MIEDSLRPDQRIRLEAVAQANARLGPRGTERGDLAVTELLREADRITQFIANGEIRGA